jgi:hypothetical protein
MAVFISYSTKDSQFVHKQRMQMIAGLKDSLSKLIFHFAVIILPYD